jgi:hypothetical protein
LRFPLPETVAGTATCVFRSTAAAPPANAVIAIESTFPARRLALQDGVAGPRAANMVFYFTGWHVVS